MSYAHHQGIHYSECEMNMGQSTDTYPNTLNPYNFILYDPVELYAAWV